MAEVEREFYAGANGDKWSLVQDGRTDTIIIKHQPSDSFEGQRSHTTLQNFLTGPYGPQHNALIQLIRMLLHAEIGRQNS
jgi:hypothetical protein